VYYPIDPAGLVRAAWVSTPRPSGPRRREPTGCAAPTPASGGLRGPGSTAPAARPPGR